MHLFGGEPSIGNDNFNSKDNVQYIYRQQFSTTLELTVLHCIGDVRYTSTMYSKDLSLIEESIKAISCQNICEESAIAMHTVHSHMLDIKIVMHLFFLFFLFILTNIYYDLYD